MHETQPERLCGPPLGFYFTVPFGPDVDDRPDTQFVKPPEAKRRRLCPSIQMLVNLMEPFDWDVSGARLTDGWYDGKQNEAGGKKYSTHNGPFDS
jgi:hypothetical protein